jgi:hypothetical protein
VQELLVATGRVGPRVVVVEAERVLVKQGETLREAVAVVVMEEGQLLVVLAERLVVGAG